MKRGIVEETLETCSFCGMLGCMEFRLAYDGILRRTTAGCARVNIKHAIRKEIQKQLKTLWSIQPRLLELATHKIILEDPLTGEPHVWTMLDQIVAKYKRFGFNFAPLVRRTFGHACDLEILFLCQKAPKAAAAKDRELRDWASLLLEALRLPRYVHELPVGAVPDADPGCRRNGLFLLLAGGQGSYPRMCSDQGQASVSAKEWRYPRSCSCDNEGKDRDHGLH